ncbi:MAG: hypothetical protein KGI83_02685 [Verrucomicrobiota bacterium]|nr:hypothetical protein [Verrucomicrobiota bacterium]
MKNPQLEQVRTELARFFEVPDPTDADLLAAVVMRKLFARPQNPPPPPQNVHFKQKASLIPYLPIVREEKNQISNVRILTIQKEGSLPSCCIQTPIWSAEGAFKKVDLALWISRDEANELDATLCVTQTLKSISDPEKRVMCKQLTDNEYRIYQRAAECCNLPRLFVSNPPLFVTELYNEGSLKGKVLSDLEFLSVCTNLTRQLAILHEQKIAHQDIKPDNVLCTRMLAGAFLRTAFTDFGLAIDPKTPHELRGLAGTPQYYSPDKQSLALLGRLLHQITREANNFMLGYEQSLMGIAWAHASSISRIAKNAPAAAQAQAQHAREKFDRWKMRQDDQASVSHKEILNLISTYFDAAYRGLASFYRPLTEEQRAQADVWALALTLLQTRSHDNKTLAFKPPIDCMSCSGCSGCTDTSSTRLLNTQIEEALQKAAPGPETAILKKMLSPENPISAQEAYESFAALLEQRASPHRSFRIPAPPPSSNPSRNPSRNPSFFRLVRAGSER